jgi:crossover junction endodeoxyribonuclease RuvC
VRIIGIDPGASGALVALEDGMPIEWMRMPTIKVNKTTRVNGAAVARWIRSVGPEHTYVEQVNAMPGQGVVSMFSFGASFGTLIGVLAALEEPYSLVTPQAWKRAAGLIGMDKDASRARASQMWPQWHELDTKSAGQAYADAALIARYGSG